MKKFRLIWAGLLAAPALAFAAPQAGGSSGQQNQGAQSGQQSGQQGGQGQFGANPQSLGANQQGGQGGAGQAGQQGSVSGGAQGGQAGGQGNIGQELGPSKGGGVGQEAAVRGLIQGTVANVNFSKGELSISAGQQGNVVIRGTPGQLQNYRKGEFTSVPYADYAGHRWLVSNPSQLQPQTFARATTVVGVVQSVNKAAGQLKLSRNGKTVTYMAHPQTLESVLPGQFVSITYEAVGKTDWIQQLRAAEHQQAGQH